MLVKIIVGGGMDNISVIIRCKNEERYIGYTIQSVLDFFKEPEIIVINDNSTDTSLEVIRSFSFADVKTYNIDSYTPGNSLNFGVTKCSNENILVISAHCEIKEINFDEVLDNLENHCVVWGKQIPIWNGRKINRRYIWSNFEDGDSVNYFSNNENRYFLHNAFSFYKRDVLLEHPFDENLIGKEDRYWINDRIEEGLTSFYNSNLICNHHYTDNGATWKGIG